jgi:hypothetical protein
MSSTGSHARPMSYTSLFQRVQAKSQKAVTAEEGSVNPRSWTEKAEYLDHKKTGGATSLGSTRESARRSTSPWQT